jgi:ABC-type sugar transport system substrate-binding protein
MKKRILLSAASISVLFLVTLALAACSGGERREQTAQTGPASASRKKAIDPYKDAIKIAWVAHEIGVPVTQAWFDGMKAEVVDYPNITLQGFDGKASAENQVKIMDEIITQKYNAIILQASDNAALAPSVTKAEQAGIPVIALNLDVDSKHAGLVKMADYDAGRLIAEQMAKQFNGKGDFVIIQGIVGGIRPAQLELGFRDAVKKFPDMKILSAQPADFQKEKAMTVMNSFLQTYDHINGVFAINDAMAMGAALAAESAGRLTGMSIWGADGEKDALTMIEQGKLTGTIYTNCKEEGSTALKLALYVLGSEYDTSNVSATAIMAMQPIIATKDTVYLISEEDRW